jgi:hypothetical protein
MKKKEMEKVVRRERKGELKADKGWRITEVWGRREDKEEINL